MRPHRIAACGLAIILAMACARAAPAPTREAAPSASPTLSWSELTHMPLPSAGERIAYGNGAQQVGELRVPKGKGPFPGVVLIHGGCWQSAFDYVYITRLGAWFAQHGVASRTIEYRRLGDKGGGWPGAFLDVAQAADFLRQVARTHPIDVKRSFAVGHSAGGQLALWPASCSKLPADSELFRSDPLPIRGVLGLAAITDLATYRIGPPDSCNSAVDPLLGGSQAGFPRRYAETLPQQRLPLGAPQFFIQGERDPIVDPASVHRYVAAATRAGDRAVISTLPEAGHFEASVPTAQTEHAFKRALRFLLNAAPASGR